MRIVPLAVSVACLIGAPIPAAAQAVTPSPVIELSVGYAGFIDDATIDHAVVGGSARWYITRRLSVGPEVVYTRGPGRDRDLFVTGNLIVDLLTTLPGTAPRVTPYLVVGAGLFRHSDRFGDQRFASTEGAVTGGGGVRLQITPRVSLAPELRVGWEPHYRASVTVGYRWR